nr:hypothetical protein [Cohnella fermenti]
MDSGNDSLDNLKVCHRHPGVDYIIKVNLRKTPKATWLAIAKEKGIACEQREGKIEYVGAIEFPQKGVDDKLRQVLHVIKRTIDRDGQIFDLYGSPICSSRRAGCAQLRKQLSLVSNRKTHLYGLHLIGGVKHESAQRFSAPSPALQNERVLCVFLKLIPIAFLSDFPVVETTDEHPSSQHHTAILIPTRQLYSPSFSRYGSRRSPSSTSVRPFGDAE